MGESQTKESAAQRVNKSISNYELRIKNYKRNLYSFAFICSFFACLAVNGLAQTPESLSAKINSGDSEQKREALFQIRNLHSPEFSRLALPLLLDSSEIIRATAVSSIIYLPGVEATNYLLPLLKDKAELVRRETALALGKTQDPKAIDPLIETFQKDKILEVRNATIIALGEIGDAGAVNFLTAILQRTPKDEEDFMRRSAARSIGQIAKFIQTHQTQAVTPSSLLPEKYKITEKPQFTNLVESFPAFRSALGVLIQVLQNPKESNDARRESAFALGEIRDASALSVLQANLTNQDYYLAEICREAIEKINLK